MKIVVDNRRPSTDSDEAMDEQEDTLEPIEEPTVLHVNFGKKRKSAKDENLSDVSEDDDDEEEDETEFHVNLDKVPPSLQNTTLVNN